MACQKVCKLLKKMGVDCIFHSCITIDACPDCGGDLKVFNDDSIGHGYPFQCKDCSHTFWKANVGLHSRHTPHYNNHS